MNRRRGDRPTIVRQVSHEEMTQNIQRDYDRLLIRYAELEIELERTGRKLAEYRARLDRYAQEEKQQSDESTTG